MTFHCTLVRGPRALRQGEPVELTIAIGDGDSGALVQDSVAAEFRTGELMVHGFPLSGLTVGAAPLVPGAVLVDGADRPGHDASDGGTCPPALSLLVHAGPTAGLVVPLERGSYRIGRSNTDICLPDPDVSRVHAVLTISETAVTITDDASANGTIVDGCRIRSALLSTASRIQIGGSVMSIVFDDEDYGAESLGAAGLSVTEPLPVPRRSDPNSRTQLLFTAGLPLLLGVGMALATGMWMFVGFTAISAIAVLAPAISGRRQRRALAAALEEAVEQDRARRRRCSPSAAELAFAISSSAVAASQESRRKQFAPPRTSTAHKAMGSDEIWLRLGTSQQNALGSLDPADPSFEPPLLGRVPVVLDPAIQAVSLSGPEAKVDDMLRFLLMQLAAFPSAENVPILIHGPIALLPSSARFLPRVTMVADVAAAMTALSAAAGGTAGVLLLVSLELDPGIAALRKAAAESGWRIFQRTASRDQADCTVELWNKSAVLRFCLSEVEFDPDLVPHSVFDRFCRSLAAAPAPSTTKASAVPSTCLLAELLPNDASSIAARWNDSSGSSGLSAVIGQSADAPRSLDVVSDGPHLLVAGTTGSGKSELLRTIVSAISLTHSPDRVNFLFVDFKGGSGLGPLRGLPQCVGMLTDLSEYELERTLSSLRSEVRLRETLLAKANVPDLPAYWAKSGRAGDGVRGISGAQLTVLPRLVLVIDEFRMLIEDAPAALAELMRIATLGRSLGIHLIMATQRPQGALSADIRANVTTSIALRVQSEMESRDIINSPAAAAIPVSLPGRAYVVRGTEDAEPFQSATLSRGQRVCSLPKTVARTAAEALCFNSTDAAEGQAEGSEATPAEAARPIIKAINRVWDIRGGRPLRTPVADPLPESILLSQLLSATTSAGKHAAPRKALGPGAYLGLVDLPEQQQVVGLHWLPSVHGNLGLVGPPTGGADDACRAIAAQLVGGAEELHMYVLDGDGSFADVSAEGRVGAVASLDDARRGVRILERLAAEMSARQSRGAVVGEVSLLLVISSWGSWVSQLRTGPFAWAEDLVHTIVRDGPKSGVTVLVTGDRELVTSRPFASIPNRAYFPTGTTEEGRLAWPRFAAMKPVRARAVVSGNFLDVDTAVAQLVTPPPGIAWPYCEPPGPALRPFRVEPLPRFVKVSDIATEARTETETTVPSPAGSAQAVLLGLGGDEHEPAWITLSRSAILPVLGTPGSGKSSLLAALRLLNPGHRWLSPPQGADPDVFWPDFHRDASHELVSAGAILLVDDAEHLSSKTSIMLAELPGMGFSVVATAGHSPALLQRSPLISHARNCNTGILLGARSPSDGDFFGVRIEVEPAPPPGRAVLIENGQTRSLQVAAPG